MNISAAFLMLVFLGGTPDEIMKKDCRVAKEWITPKPALSLDVFDSRCDSLRRKMFRCQPLTLDSAMKKIELLQSEAEWNRMMGKSPVLEKYPINIRQTNPKIGYTMLYNPQPRDFQSRILVNPPANSRKPVQGKGAIPKPVLKYKIKGK
ncbi:MAG: hypothetical protein AB1656_21155 [Candidatus Omnitrophota bacterium]